jgi:potassium-transporting ATPase KdpC subunit
MLAAIRLSLVLLLLCGGIYPAVTVAIGQIAFNRQANGSLVTKADGTVIGSSLIAQPFDQDKYFHPRPSAAGSFGYDASASSGSNLGPTSKALVDRISGDAQALKGENPALTTLPADLLTTSASGLDPDITVDAAMAQVPRVAKARGLTESAVAQLVLERTIGRDLGLFGTPRLNVLSLNLALAALK